MLYPRLPVEVTVLHEARSFPSTSLGTLTHSALLRVILSLPAVSQTLSLSNGSLSNPSNG
jgi:hypothetical protein